MKVPLLDLKRQYSKIRREALAEITGVCDSQHYILGRNVAALEAEIAAYTGVEHAVGVASGTDALLVSLMAAGVGHGDAVLTTPFTFFATAGSIARLGAVPVFADIDPVTFNVDPGSLEDAARRAGKRAKAVMPVHLFGQCADMDPIMKMARKRKLVVIEDAAQSIGALYKGKKAGSIGDLGCYSFYPTKNLGCFGDGGMVTAKGKKLFELVKTLRVHGSRVRYYHDLVGVNSRLDELQAAVLRVKLKHLDGWAAGRAKNAARYDSLFKKAGLDGLVGLPRVAEGCVSVYNQYVVRVKKRDELRAYLSGIGIGTEIYYPLSMHEQKCFKDLGYKRGSLPESEKAAREVLALPIYPELTRQQQIWVVEGIAGFYREKGLF